jgi:hypothetical protein
VKMLILALMRSFRLAVASKQYKNSENFNRFRTENWRIWSNTIVQWAQFSHLLSRCDVRILSSVVAAQQGLRGVGAEVRSRI